MVDATLATQDEAGDYEVVASPNQRSRADVAQFRWNRLTQVVQFNQGDAGRVIFAAHDRGVGAGKQRRINGSLEVISRRDAGGDDRRGLHGIILPVIVRNGGQARTIQLQDRIGQDTGNAGDRRSDGSQEHVLGRAARDDEPADADILARLNAHPGGEVQGLRSWGRARRWSRRCDSGCGGSCSRGCRGGRGGRCCCCSRGRGGRGCSRCCRRSRCCGGSRCCGCCRYGCCGRSRRCRRRCYSRGYGRGRRRRRRRCWSWRYPRSWGGCRGWRPWWAGDGEVSVGNIEKHIADGFDLYPRRCRCAYRNCNGLSPIVGRTGQQDRGESLSSICRQRDLNIGATNRRKRRVVHSPRHGLRRTSRPRYIRIRRGDLERA